LTWWAVRESYFGEFSVLNCYFESLPERKKIDIAEFQFNPLVNEKTEKFLF
jgi:hypothetical protein